MRRMSSVVERYVEEETATKKWDSQESYRAKQFRKTKLVDIQLDMITGEVVLWCTLERGLSQYFASWIDIPVSYVWAVSQSAEFGGQQPSDADQNVQASPTPETSGPSWDLEQVETNTPQRRTQAQQLAMRQQGVLPIPNALLASPVNASLGLKDGVFAPEIAQKIQRFMVATGIAIMIVGMKK